MKLRSGKVLKYPEEFSCTDKDNCYACFRIQQWFPRDSFSCRFRRDYWTRYQDQY